MKKPTLDHIGIAVKDLEAALTFYRDALGLEVEQPEDVPSERVRAHLDGKEIRQRIVVPRKLVNLVV